MASEFMEGKKKPRKPFGRRTVDRRPSGEAVKATSRQIDRDIPRCWQAIIDALSATKWIQVNGEWKEVPDHFTRIGAAKIGLSKRIPDLQKTEMSGHLKFTPLRIIADETDA